MQAESQSETQSKFGVVDLVWFVALVAACVRFVQLACGFDFDGTNLVVAVALLLPILALPSRPIGLVEVLVVFVISGILYGLVSNWFIFFYCGTLIVRTLVRSARKIRDRIRWQTGALLVTILLGSVADQVVPPRRVAWLREAQRSYPKVNMAPRLASLRPGWPVENRSESHEQFHVANAYRDVPYRIHQLSRVHNSTYERFIERLGFGMVRMISLHPDSLAIPDLQDIDFGAGRASVSRPSVANTWFLSDKPTFDIEKMEPLTDDALLQRTYGNFIHPATLGFSLQRKQAVGFATHGFRSPMPDLVRASDSLRIKRLELVSLLNFESPRVYILDHLPRMDQLRGEHVQTRELNSFESNGLEQLKHGSRIAMDDKLTPARMLGAIPMIQQCQECHTGNIGDLLGAFSYEFER